MRGPMARRPLGAKTDLQLAASKKTGPISYTHQERNSANNLDELEESSEWQLRPQYGRHLNCSFVRP